MAYVDYTYYTTEYLQGMTALIPSTDFGYYELQARTYIKDVTLNKSDDNSTLTEVKNCTCAIAEALFKQAKSKSESGNDGNLASEKVGEYSVSYKSKSVVMAENEAEKKDIVRRYLGITGLLYRGA